MSAESIDRFPANETEDGVSRRAFALLEIVIVMAIIAVVAGGGYYFLNGDNIATQHNNAVNDEEAARAVVQQENSSTQAAQNILDQITEASPAAQSTPIVPAPVSPPPTSLKSTSTTETKDLLAGLGSNMYSSGVLPLGDGKYVTSGPKKGYIYLCNANLNGGGGAEESGPWIGTDTWNINNKIAVSGAVSWPAASVSISVQGSTRTVVTNDLPKGVTTGNFPIAASDPAYAYDHNPNSVKTQSITLALPADPTFAAAPSCIGGEVGVMTDGVMLFDGFDAELRDAVAHEVQDSCDGHPQEAGEYHYHGQSACLSNDEATVIGFAFDGFPITGAKISDDRYLTTADLDECHGITSSIVLDGKNVTMYHYVMMEDFPYSVSCFRGTPTVHGPTVPQMQSGQGQRPLP